MMDEDSMIRIPFNGALLVFTPEEFVRAIKRGKYLLRGEKTQEREQGVAEQWPEVWPHDT